MRAFVCKESQELISIFNYHPSQLPERYKAQRNGLPMVVQFTPVPLDGGQCNIDFSTMSLCPGIEESRFLPFNQPDVANIYIEKVGDTTVYRSRDCQLIMKSSNELCLSCAGLISSSTHEKLNTILKEEPKVLCVIEYSSYPLLQRDQSESWL